MIETMMIQTIRRRALGVLCALLLLTSVFPGSLAPAVAGEASTPTASPEISPTPEVSPAPTPEAVTALSREESPVKTTRVRVLLTQIAEDSKEIKLTLKGRFAVGENPGFRFADGAALTVVRERDGLYLATGALYLFMGNNFVLTRHPKDADSPATGGVLFPGRSKNVFPGDLAVSSGESGIRLVLHTDVEEYLPGVLPYEMNDKFPLEALKAQAVAARTYALAGLSPSRDYDVYDTAKDQVYRGTDADYKNVQKAVDETAGVCGLYKGKLARCYFTASNGGQIDLVQNAWPGDGDFGYIQMKDDPYDLENPSSSVKELRIPRAPTEQDPLPAALDSLLRAGVAESLAASGFSDELSDIRIASVVYARLDSPMDASPSRRYTKLQLYVKPIGRRIGYVPFGGETPMPHLSPTPSATPTATPTATPVASPEITPETTPEITPSGTDIAITPAPTLVPTGTPPPERVLGDWELLSGYRLVDIATYEDIKDGMGLKINPKDYEVFDIAISESAYTLSARRFGHGVGMSQRGAQTMAKSHGKNYLEILSFYYPGMQLARLTPILPERKPLSLLSPELFMTAAPTPSPTPRPTPAPLPEVPEGARVMRVALSTADSTLNVRAAADGNATILGSLINGQSVIVLEQLESGWSSIKTAELEGFASSKYLTE